MSTHKWTEEQTTSVKGIMWLHHGTEWQRFRKPRKQTDTCTYRGERKREIKRKDTDRKKEEISALMKVFVINEFVSSDEK